MFKDVIGIVGGMGSFATLYMFQEILNSLINIIDEERPRIVVDNYCNIPNKILACLSDDEKEPFLSYLSESITNLINIGCTKIIIACNITHIILDSLYEIHPYYKKYIVNMIEVLSNKIVNDNIKTAYLFATKNAINSKVFQKYIPSVEFIYPDSPFDRDEIVKLMYESKNKNITKNIKERFNKLCKKYNDKPIILGCTELSMICSACKCNDTTIYDPICETIKHLLDTLA